MMDYMLPDEQTIELMNKEYAKHNIKNASIFALNSTPARDARVFDFQTVILILYIVRFLRYNDKYGIEIYDAHRSVGRIQPSTSTFGIVNNLK